MELIAANTTNLQFRCTDKYGTILQDLATATNVLFMIKKNATDPNTSAILSLNFASGITVNNPDTGYVKVPISYQNAEIEAGTYYFGLKIIYPNEEHNIVIKENGTTINQLTIINDIIDP